MAERSIRTIGLFKSLAVGSGSAGGTSATDPIDLRDISKEGNFSVSYKITTAGAAATCASTKISYLGCAVYNGSYISPTDGTFGTFGNTGGTDIVTISPPVIPFMKIQVVAGTSGTALVTAELHVR